MNAFMVTARRALATLGWLGILGLVLLVSTVVMYATVVQDRTARLAELKRESASLKSRIELAAKTGIPETGSMDELNKFYGFFSGTTLTEWLDKLYQAAATQKLVLEQGDLVSRELPRFVRA